MAKKTVEIDVDEVDVLRAHAVGAALSKARPKDYMTNVPAREAWEEAVRQVAAVVCTADGTSLTRFYGLCGVLP
jgi:hypothetical protein